jgi:threonine synthase
MASFVSHLECPRCGRVFDHRRLETVCECGSPLLVEYDLERVAGAAPREALTRRDRTMWRYRELLPVEDEGRIVTLGEGGTPLMHAERLGRAVGVPDLWVKDEGLLPTGTFKARGAACGVTAAVERGVREVALPSAGNAGGAWAAYGATAGVAVHVAMPADTPELMRLECEAYGASVTLVDGSIADAGRVIADDSLRNGWFDAATLREPYRVEGKKTLGLEIAEQLGWQFPDAIVYPAGGGVGLIGIWRAVTQLRSLGWVKGTPRLVIVQAAGCAPLVAAFREGCEESEPWPDPRTLAVGLRVPKPLGDFLVLRAVRETDGTAVSVTDDAILSAMTRMAREARVSACPEGASTLAAVQAMRSSGDLDGSERVVLVNTGTALKYPEALRQAGSRT